jgi:hypothetical protein
MTTKANPLAAALRVHERRPPTPPMTAPELERAAEPLPRPAAADRKRPPSRRGKKVLNVHVEPEVSKQLRQLALDQDSSVQNIVIEALNDLFTKYRRSPLA